MVPARLNGMKVEDLMTRDVLFCAPTDPLNVAAKIMWEQDCGCVPVVDKEMVPVGIVTDRDICMGAYTQGLPLNTIPVETVMAKPVLTCEPDDELVIAEEIMRDNRIRRVVVCDLAGKLVGIVSISDLARESEHEQRVGTDRLIRSGELAQVLGAVSEPRPHAMNPIPFGPEPGELEFQPKPPIKRGHARR